VFKFLVLTVTTDMTFITYVVTLYVHFTIVILKNGKYYFKSRHLLKPLKLETDQD